MRRRPAPAPPARLSGPAGAADRRTRRRGPRRSEGWRGKPRIRGTTAAGQGDDGRVSPWFPWATGPQRGGVRPS
nr:MAG: hypothetical protein DIU59_11425 [Pseudomonadota bacterium]